MDSPHSYQSPLTQRYASKEMAALFSLNVRAITFRKLWVALAKGQKNSGLPITDAQIAALESAMDKINWPTIEAYEKKFHHDVMAHIHAFGDLCPTAKGIIHLGATSCYVTDNADLILMKQGLSLLFQKMVSLLEKLAGFARKHAHHICLGMTHYQKAQPTTFGKRACLWLQDFLWDAKKWHSLLHDLPFLGMKGATGSQSSLLCLFQGDEEKILKLDAFLAEEFGFSKTLIISGQTYPRKLDTLFSDAFAGFAASAHKMGTDLRLLAHDHELLETFEKEQVGSSAMPYKHNPIYSERVCGIARFILSLAPNALYTLATQWLERSLDDSSNRRLFLPQLFLSIDALLNLLIHLVEHLNPNRKIAEQNLDAYRPYLMTENLLMAAVQKGGDRQKLHEKLRQLSLQGSPETLLSRIGEDPDFLLSQEELCQLSSNAILMGRSAEQVEEFLEKELFFFLHSIQKPSQK